MFILFFTTSMGNMSRGFIVIESSSGTKQGGPLNGHLFDLTHYCTFLGTITWTPNCVFPSLMDDTHILGPMNEVIFNFDHLSTN
jgi:hypothetical protein